MSWLSRLFQRRTLERQLDAELQDHLARLVADYRRAGLSRQEATRRARLAFGGVDQTKEQCRDTRGTRWAHDIAQDVRYGVRLLTRSPGLASVIIASLSLGIGANTAIYTLVDSVLVRSLPVREPHQLAVLEGGSWTNPIWEQVRDRQGGIAAGALAWSDERFDLATRGEATPVDGFFASGALFEVLGVPAVLGRTLRVSDDRRDGGADGPVAVISHRLWQQRYGGARDVIGRPITLNRMTYTIVGVTPAGFMGPTLGRAADVAVPIGTIDLMRGGESNELEGRSHWWLEIMFRLRPGQTPAEASAALRAVQPQIREATQPSGWPKELQDSYLRDALTISAASGGSTALRGQYGPPLLILMGGVALVLLIACANVANLLLARANARRHEISARLALGASRGRVARQLLTESLLFAIPGAALGTAFAVWASRYLVEQLSTPGRTVALDLTLNWRVLAFTAAVAVATSLLFGVAPAWRATRIDPHDALADHARGSVGERRRVMSSSLVVVQVALSLVLIVGAGLFVRTFTTLASLDLGLDTRSVLTVAVDAGRASVGAAERGALFARLADVAAAVPGTAAQAVSVIPPMTGMGWNNLFHASGEPPSSFRDRDKMAYLNAVTPGFFATYGITLRAGRDFTARDGKGAAPVVIVNEAFVKKFLKGQPPIGQMALPGARPGDPQERWEIVGVVRDAAYRALRPPFPPTVYRPLAQLPSDGVFPFASVAVRANGELTPAYSKAIVEALGRVDPGLSLTVLPFDQQVRSLMTRERLLAQLSGGLGGLALLLACVGLYGVTAYAVSRRRTEIGIRMALGADGTRVVRLIVGNAALLVVLGVAAGAGLSLWVTRFVGTLLYGLEPRDASTLIGAALLLVTIGAVATWLPARRAARIDPARVLREG